MWSTRSISYEYDTASHLDFAARCTGLIIYIEHGMGTKIFM